MSLLVDKIYFVLPLFTGSAGDSNNISFDAPSDINFVRVRKQLNSFDVLLAFKQNTFHGKLEEVVLLEIALSETSHDNKRFWEYYSCLDVAIIPRSLIRSQEY